LLSRRPVIVAAAIRESQQQQGKQTKGLLKLAKGEIVLPRPEMVGRQLPGVGSMLTWLKDVAHMAYTWPGPYQRLGGP